MAYNTPNSLPACIYLTLVMYNAKKNATSALGEASGGKSLLIELSALIRNSRNVGGVYATKRDGLNCGTERFLNLKLEGYHYY